MNWRSVFPSLLVAALVTLTCLSPVQAVEPDEVLSDPALEARARALSKGLRCLVCRNESIDESHAQLAKDLRVLVRERLSAGDSDQEVLDYVVDRYGEYVLLRPTVQGSNWLLWAAGPGMLLLAGGVGLAFVRRRSRAEVDEAQSLSPEERDRLAKILEN